MKADTMSTVRLEAPVEDLPETWRKERAFNEGDVIVVTVKNKVAEQGTFWDAAAQVAGIWADRTDEEIDAWQSDMREARRRRFEELFPDTDT